MAGTTLENTASEAMTRLKRSFAKLILLANRCTKLEQIAHVLNQLHVCNHIGVRLRSRIVFGKLDLVEHANRMPRSRLAVIILYRG